MRNRTEPPSDPAVGTPRAARRVPGYQLLETLTPTLVRARSHADNRAVCLCFPDGPGPEAEARLRREHAVLARLALEGVPRVLDLLASDAGPVLVLEGFRGRPLSLQLPLDELPAFFAIATATCDLLEALHARGSLHRDLQPAALAWDPESEELTLLGFGGATLAEDDELALPGELDGELAYISPEQTGRTEHAVDRRSDLYALGATCYQLLTGRLPFEEADPRKLVHSHLAVVPPPPHELNPGLPEGLSALIAKLLEKDPALRYQTAAGLKRDLLECAWRWREQRAVPRFPLGRDDTSPRFTFPERLFGREAELDALQLAFARVCEGGVEVVTVRGYLGIGKTALLNGLRGPVESAGGLFACATCDPHRRLPLAVWIEALQKLIVRLGAGPEARRETVRARLRARLGRNAAVVAQALPEIVELLGPQPEVPELSPSESQSRFHRAFLHCIAGFSGPGQPCVLALDDLHAADPLSLQMLERLAVDGLADRLLIIAAYRDREVGAGHPVRELLDFLEHNGTPIAGIVPRPLREGDLVALLSAALGGSARRLGPLAEICRAKTEGNPFFLRQFLQDVVGEELIRFSRGRWSWDLAAIAARTITDNVVDMLAARLSTLSAPCLELVTVAAVVGTRFRTRTLAFLTDVSTAASCEQVLAEAVREGLVRPRRGRGEGGYKFVHERVREASYRRLPRARRAALHLRLGRHWRASLKSTESGHRLFDVVKHLNRGARLLEKPEERLELARLNLEVGRQARLSGGFELAYNLFGAGLRLLGDGGWDGADNALCARLAAEAAEAAGLCGKESARARLCRTLAARARAPLDKLRAHELSVRSLAAAGRPAAALAEGEAGLALLGLHPPAPSGPWRKRWRALWLRARVRPGEWDPARREPDPEQAAPVRLLAALLPAAFCAAPERLGGLLSLALERAAACRDAKERPTVLMWYALSVVAPRGLVLGRKALALAEAGEDPREIARTQTLFDIFLRFWLPASAKPAALDPLTATLEPLREDFERCLGRGDLEYAFYALNALLERQLFLGLPLDDTDRTVRAARQALTRAGQPRPDALLARARRLLETLVGAPDEPGEAGPRTSSGRIPARASPSLRPGFDERLCALLFPDQEPAPSSSTPPSLPGFDCLLELAIGRDTPAERRAALARGQRLLDRVARCRAQAPARFGGLHLLLGASLAALEGDEARARLGFDRAIDEARASHHVLCEALAFERAGRMFAARGRGHLTGHYLAEARDAYRRWGAEAKVRELEERFGTLLRPVWEPTVEPGTGSMGRSQRLLDIPSVLSASQALSGELELGRLLERLLGIVLENAGAQRACLVLAEQGGLRIEAAGELDTIRTVPGVAVDATFEGRQLVPPDIVGLVFKSGESFVCADAMRDRQLSDSAYITAHRPRSILCAPLSHQGRTLGIVYLENNLTPGSFTAERVQMVRLIATQAAISITNARAIAARAERDRMRMENEFLEKQARALEKSEARFRRLSQAAFEGIVVLEDGQIVDANPAFTRICAARREELVGRPLLELIAAPSRGLVESRLADRAGEPFEFVGLRRDESRYVGEMRTRRLQDEGRELGVVAIRDVTDSKRMERELREAKEAAEQATHAKSTFLAHMSHEIRTPMHGVLGMAELLLRAGLDEKPSGYVEAIRRSADALLRVIDDILDFSKIEAGRLELEETPVDLSGLFEDIVELLRFAAENKRVALRVEMAADVPRVVLADPVRLRQVLVNLVGNAVKFTDAGEVVLAARCIARTDSVVQLAIDVRDTGIGIPAGQLSRIFDQFAQADISTTRRHGGTGLGLSISRGLVAMMGGSIAVRSTVGEGSVFSLQVAFREASADALASAPPAARRGTTLLPRLGLKVLLVEDNPINLMVALGYLEEMACEVEIARHGRHALEQLRSHRYDVVLMDIEMPEMDGYETTRRFRAEEGPTRTRIVAMTAKSREEDRERYLAAGMDDFLPKPMRPEAMARVLCGVAVGPPARAEPAPDEQPVFAPERGLGTTGGDVPRLRQLARLVLEEGAGRLRELDAADAGDRLDELRRIVHTLKGDAAHIGAERVRALAQGLERVIDDRAARAALVPQLHAAFAALQHAVARCDWARVEEEAR